MRIQHNIMAMNAYRNYNLNTKSLSGNLEKLSSGYKINRAGDDAAGLAISEKMRAQITGLDAAQKNVKDGISLVKTAEGAMQEIHDMLNKMDYLATQSANGTYQDDVDRENLQKEIQSLKTEIDRIADSSNFNGIKLLDGSLETGRDMTPSLDLPEVGSEIYTNTVLHSLPATSSKGSSFELHLENNTIKAGSSGGKVTVKIGDLELSISIAKSTTITTSALASKIKSAAVAKGAWTVNGKTFTLTTKGISKATQISVTVDGSTVKFTQSKAPTKEGEVFSIPQSVKITLGNGLSWKNNTGTNGKVSKGQDYNAALVNQHQVNLDDRPRLASTKFTLTKDMVTNGTTIRLADKEYEFTDDIKYKGKYSQGKIYIGDLDPSNAADLKTAGSRFTEAAASKSGGNDYFSVGFDGTSITLTEKKGKIGYTQTAVSQDNYDFRYMEDTDGKKGLRSAIEVSYANPKVGNALTLQIGDTADSFNQMKVSVGDMHVKAMGTKGGKSISDIDISTQAGAQEAVAVIKDAINYVSSIRGDLGAIQNRLDHTGNNLSVMAENIQDAESTIRDTDVADEMMKYVKNNILVQSAQAMLAQANQVPQGVLQLLG